jgi:hypothetical protein
LLTEKREFPCVHSTQTNREVYNRTKDNWGDNCSGDFSNDLSEEISRHRVHVVVHFSEENRALVGENQNDVLDRVKSDCHGHEEESTVSVLHTLYSPIAVLKKNDAKDSSDNGDDEFNI